MAGAPFRVYPQALPDGGGLNSSQNHVRTFTEVFREYVPVANDNAVKPAIIWPETEQYSRRGPTRVSPYALTVICVTILLVAYMGVTIEYDGNWVRIGRGSSAKHTQDEPESKAAPHGKLEDRDYSRSKEVPRPQPTPPNNPSRRRPVGGGMQKPTRSDSATKVRDRRFIRHRSGQSKTHQMHHRPVPIQNRSGSDLPNALESANTADTWIGRDERVIEPEQDGLACIVENIAPGSICIQVKEGLTHEFQFEWNSTRSGHRVTRYCDWFGCRVESIAFCDMGCNASLKALLLDATAQWRRAAFGER